MKKFRSGKYLIFKEDYKRFGAPEEFNLCIEKFSSLKELINFMGFDIDEIKKSVKEEEDLVLSTEDVVQRIIDGNGDGTDFYQIYSIDKNDNLRLFIG